MRKPLVQQGDGTRHQVGRQAGRDRQPQRGGHAFLVVSVEQAAGGAEAQRARDALGVRPEDCVAFEDSISGILSAEAAGTKAVGIPNVAIIPAIEGRTLWKTLENVTIADLRKLF